MISQTAEYALRAVICLADSETRLLKPAVAEATQVPPEYLSKVLQGLVKAGILESWRGPKGGFALARPASEMTVLEVVNAVDPIERILECPLGLADHDEALCPLHQRLDDAVAALQSTLGGATIEVLLCGPSRPLAAGAACGGPRTVS